MSGNIWNCPTGRAEYCWAPVWCESFAGTNTSSYNYTDFNFKIIFNGDTEDYILLPLQSLMRNALNSPTPRCNILVLVTYPNSG